MPDEEASLDLMIIIFTQLVMRARSEDLEVPTCSRIYSKLRFAVLFMDCDNR
jgi:hypothetical protein